MMDASAYSIRKITDAPIQSRDDLLLSAWLKRDLPPRDYLLGHVFCTTSRWMIYGETGVGKTLFAADMGAAIASGSPFLNWEARRSAVVMYLDGELPAETFKERMQLIGERFGSEIPFYGYNREALGDDGQMPPLNTPIGQAWLWREIELIKPDVIFFDSIMCLLGGSMSEEESWEPVKPLVRQLSGQRIGQVWLHHTGHDSSKGFGTKTREWELDTVLSLTKPDGEDDGGVLAEFKKARLRVPRTALEFETRIIRRAEDGWTPDGVRIATMKGGKRSLEIARLRGWFLNAYDRLADSVAPTPGFDGGSSVRKVSVEDIRAELVNRGFLETNEKGHVTATSRSHLRRIKTDLFQGGTFVESDGMIWRIKDDDRIEIRTAT
jgi:hypothetical protein